MDLDNFEQEERIDRYLSHQMTEEEQLAFEQEMEESKALKEEVILSRLIQTYHTHPEIPQIRELIQQTAKAHKEKENTTPIISLQSRFKKAFPIVVLAASIILAIILLPNLYKSETDVFSDYFTPNPNLEIIFEVGDLELISATDEKIDVKKVITQIEMALEHKDYDKAFDLSNQLINKENWVKDELILYRANALLGKGNIEAAIDEYQQLIANRTDLESATKWYLALAYIRNETKEDAQKELEEIILLEDEIYSEKAKNLLEVL